MYRHLGFRAALAFVLALVLLATTTGCANVSSGNMVPASFDSTKRVDRTVQVIVDTTKANDHFKGWVEDSQFKAAIEQSLLRSKMFTDVKPSGGNYQLRVVVTSVGQFWGLDFKVAVNTTWEVVDLQTQAPVWRDVVSSDFGATFSDAFAGAKRVRLAYEGALKENIRQGINLMSISLQ